MDCAAVYMKLFISKLGTEYRVFRCAKLAMYMYTQCILFHFGCTSYVSRAVVCLVFYLCLKVDTMCFSKCILVSCFVEQN